MNVDPEKIIIALSSKRRLEILKILCEENCSATQIARKLKISPPAATRHIKELESAGIVFSATKQEEGNRPVLEYSIKEGFSILLSVKKNNFGLKYQ